MRASLQHRSTAAVVLSVPLLAVLILAAAGVVESLDTGARSARVAELARFSGTLTTLADRLQRERAVAGPAAGGEARLAARRAVDGAAAAYRDAAVRFDGEGDRRIDAGLARLAELQALRASVDGAAGAGDPPEGSGEPQGGAPVKQEATATLFRRYTEVIGGLLVVNGETGRHEAGQDGGLLRPVLAGVAFSRAKELADRERDVAARAAALGRLDPAERIRLATLGGRQDALLDQFGTLAGPGQRQRWERALPAAEAQEAGRLRGLALQSASGSRPGLDLAAWSDTTATRVERMREVEPGLHDEVARLAGLAGRAADRRALAQGAVLLLAGCFATALLLLVPGRAAGRREPAAEQPDDGFGRLEAALGGAAAGPPAVRAADPGPRPPVPEPVAALGLVDLARRGQELADQQLELLGQGGPDHADPRLPGRLLRVDRLAGRARRNAHNLIVLAGGEPSRRWDGPAALAEVLAVAVRDNRDAPRVDVLVADDPVVPAAAADDLANLLGELIDNATAFSAPETRVRISGQEIGTGYVVEIEDRGLGMTDDELDEVNRHLAGRPSDAGGPEQRLGTWVAGRLAGRHGVKVRLRRSAYGGVTALVVLPESLATARAASPGAARQGSGTTRPLPKRAPHASLAPDLAAGEPGRPGRPEPPPIGRSPEQVRSMLSSYRSGLERGRAAVARDLPEDPEAPPPA
jgi:signal transduction histidine kinase